MTENNAKPDGGRLGDDHLSDVEDGCGCAEVWEHLSEQRAADD
jgi:hypothetical protein